MGTWGHKVGESDTFADIYDCFFEHYNNGATPEKATEHVLNTMSDVFSDSDDIYDAHFALALAQWETQSLEPSLLEKVEVFIESGMELERWEGVSDNGSGLKKRRTELTKFLSKLRKPRRSKKRRKRQQFDFYEHVLIELPSPDNLKTFSITESFVNGEYVHTVGTIMWENGGGGIFHLAYRDLEFSANWTGSHNLEIRIPNSVKDTVGHSPTPNQTYFAGDSVTLNYRFI